MILKCKSLINKSNYNFLSQLNLFIRNNSNFKNYFYDVEKYIILSRFFKLKIIIFEKKYFYPFLDVFFC